MNPTQAADAAAGSTGNQIKGYALIVLAALSWSSLGCFYKDLINSYGTSSLNIAFFRAALSAGFLLAGLLIFRPRLLIVDKRNALLMISLGLFGVAGFYTAYVFAVDLAGVGVASVLLYTAPVWITLISRQFLGETISPRQWFSLGLAFAGCTLVVDIYHLEQLKMNAAGILFGLAAGLGYALYSVFNKAGMMRGLSPWTILFYGMAVGTIVLLPMQSSSEMLHALLTPPVLVRLMAVSLLATLGSGLAFAAGLQFVPVSSAGVVATLEPVAAVALGFLLFGETMSAWQLIGGGLILVGAILSARG